MIALTSTDEALTRIFQAFLFSLNLLNLLVPAEGFEPPTYGLQNRCTTTVLSRLWSWGPIIADPTSRYLRSLGLGRPARHSHQQVIQRDDTWAGDCKPK